MDVIDKGDEYCLIDTSFLNITHFKKQYKKSSIGVSDFGILNLSAAWNSSVDGLTDQARGGYITCLNLKIFNCNRKNDGVCCQRREHPYPAFNDI
eukprot:6225714-Ditylum_brightwellii.AAC.1